MEQPESVYFETYGCAANQNNTELMEGILRQSGLNITSNKEIADILVINTCIVKGPTEKKMERRIKELKKEGKPIIVAGCMSQARTNRLEGEDVYLLGIDHIKDIAKLVKSIYFGDYESEKFLFRRKEKKVMQPKISSNKIIGITQIAQGCVGNCSYCVTKLAKKDLFSFPKSKIIRSIKDDLNHCREVWITSQDNAAYGLDKGERTLPELLEEILKIKGKYRVRLGMSNPDNILPILDRLIDVYRDKRMYKFLHIPVQSGSNRILKRMNRKYETEDFFKIVNRFRKEFPQISIATDLIAGYPGETGEDFEKSLNLINKLQPEILNVSRYWGRKGTRAAREKQIPHKIRKERAKKLMKTFKDKLKKNHKEEAGKEYEVLVNEKKKKKFLARTNNYKLVKIETNKEILGNFINVKIIGARRNHLVGRIV